jgi:hypothetical protein
MQARHHLSRILVAVRLAQVLLDKPMIPSSGAPPPLLQVAVVCSASAAPLHLVYLMHPHILVLPLLRHLAVAPLLVDLAELDSANQFSSRSQVSRCDWELDTLSFVYPILTRETRKQTKFSPIIASLACRITRTFLYKFGCKPVI